MVDDELGAGAYRDHELLLNFEQVLHLHALGVDRFDHVEGVVAALALVVDVFF